MVTSVDDVQLFKLVGCRQTVSAHKESKLSLAGHKPLRSGSAAEQQQTSRPLVQNSKTQEQTRLLYTPDGSPISVWGLFRGILYQDEQGASGQIAGNEMRGLYINLTKL